MTFARNLLVGLALVAMFICSSFANAASAAMIDDSRGWNTLCFGTNGYGCTSGQAMYVGVGLLPDMDPNGFGLESLGVYNVEVFQENGDRLYQGVPRTVRFRDNGKAQPMSWMLIPPVATYWLPTSPVTWLEIWFYVTGPNLGNSDARRIFVPINQQPCICDPKTGECMGDCKG